METKDQAIDKAYRLNQERSSHIAWAREELGKLTGVWEHLDTLERDEWVVVYRAPGRGFLGIDCPAEWVATLRSLVDASEQIVWQPSDETYP